VHFRTSPSHEDFGRQFLWLICQLKVCKARGVGAAWCGLGRCKCEVGAKPHRRPDLPARLRRSSMAHLIILNSFCAGSMGSRSLVRVLRGGECRGEEEHMVIPALPAPRGQPNVSGSGSRFVWDMGRWVGSGRSAGEGVGRWGMGREWVTGHIPGHPGQSAHGTQPETCSLSSQLSLLSMESQVFWANSRRGGLNKVFQLSQIWPAL
jgi:hypothetical protein